MGKFTRILGGGDSSAPPAPAPPPPVPKRTDPAVGEARERQRVSSLRQAGRRATILTSASGLDDEEDLGSVRIKRPTARAATVLGNIA